ncbi:OLC1v1014291C1 [Oldenlandia corymbosa var. corymbosa]|uniref:OLC1v1014291C1 n=1 Tax=Oldenlandia corymbosa var. corymbosa TaxID=529605 RepID=A0AAV1E0Q5_OLDCO|nr:OLC1v1014291C1 [Oldenlandia corymbosa var. corymbosa]
MQAPPCHLQLPPAGSRLFGPSKMDSILFTLSRTPCLPVRPASFSAIPSCWPCLQKDFRMFLHSSSDRTGRRPTFLRRTSPTSSADYQLTVVSLPGKDLNLEPMEVTLKMANYFWALLILQVISGISVGFLWYLVNMTVSAGRGGIKLWSFWLIGDRRLSWIAALASRVSLFTMMLLMVGSALCIIHLVKKEKLEPAWPMYKNRLQELVQKAGLSLPVYQSVNEGFDHAPKFRASVLVGETKYTSNSTFPDQKAADQDVAKLALESVKNIALRPKLGPLLVHQEPTYCKSILHEYAVKMNLPIPKYHTIPIEGPRAVFKSSFEFCGETYTSGEAESKKVAEQLAAKAAIQSLLGQLYKVIQSKEKFLASLFAKRNSDNEGTLKLTVEQPETTPVQQASIWAEFITEDTGRGAFPVTGGGGINKQLEFKAGVQNKFQNIGCGISRQQEFTAGVQNKFPDTTGSRIKQQPEFRTGVQNKFPIAGSGTKKQPEIGIGVQNKFPNTGSGMKRQPEFRTGVQNKFPYSGSGIKRQQESKPRMQNMNQSYGRPSRKQP